MARHRGLLLLSVCLIAGLLATNILTTTPPPSPTTVLPTLAQLPPLDEAASLVSSAIIPTALSTALPSPVESAPVTDNVPAIVNEPAQSADVVISPDAVPEQLVLRFVPGTDAQARADYLTALGGVVNQEIAALDIVVVSVPAAVMAQPLPASPVLLASEPDYYVGAQFAIPPSDPSYDTQWALPIIQAPQGWTSLPANIPPLTVAVIDSGVCAAHPDLVGRVLAGWDYIDDDGEAQDDFGHGCAVAGIIAANIDNGAGIAGVAPNARILPLRVLNGQGIGTYSDVAAAIVYATDNGAQIINLSLGGGVSSSLLEAAVNYAVEHGVTLVASGGNSAVMLYPAAYAPVIAVGSVSRELRQSAFSRYPADVYAPGESVLATTPDDGYASFDGTSFAAAYATGVAALEHAQGHILTSDGGIVAFGGNLPLAGNAPPTQLAEISDAVLDALAQAGEARVIITLHTPLSAQGTDDEAAIAQAQAAVLAQLMPDEFVAAQQYAHVPALAGAITTDGVNALRADPNVALIYLDEPVEVHSIRSATNIGAPQVHTGAVSGQLITGAGVNVAVLDSGIDMSNSAVSNSVVAQQCFSSLNGCPGETSQTNTAPDTSHHGTNISAIITAPDGVAPDAGIVAIRVLDEFGRGYNSDWMAGLDWIVTQVQANTLDVDVVNMSLGSLRLYKPAPGSEAASCDTVFPAEALAIQNVIALGIPVFAATGNQGSSDSISSPACIEGVIAVGAAYDDYLGAEPDSGSYQSELQGNWPDCADLNSAPDQITCFTNSNEWMDLVAPGAQIIVANTGGSGTSQASPHAAGVAALMVQGARLLPPSIPLTPARIEGIMQFSGPAILDARNGLSFRRLDALEAVRQAVAPIQFTSCRQDEVLGVSEAECNILVEFYNATKGTSWYNDTDWLATNTPCTWFGVTCGADGGSGIRPVTGIDMSTYVIGVEGLSNNLQGEFPVVLTGLVNLQHLNLSSNSIPGPIPPELGSLSQLETLALSSMGLTGSIPPELGQLTQLRTLNLSWNFSITGDIPPSLSNLANLENLLLFNMSLTGTLPDTGNWDQLQELGLSGNNLSGTLADLSNLTNLRVLNLYNNDVRGTIPTSLGSLTSLEILDLSNNFLVDNIPAGIGNLTNLDRVDLSNNQLDGTIPTSVGNLANVTFFDLSANRLSGGLPSLSNLNALVSFDVSYNQLTGAIPTFNSGAPLDYVALGNNQLTGTIPAQLGNFASLRYLDLSVNQLEGAVPASFGNLAGLDTLYLSYNRLTSLPPEFANLGGSFTLSMDGNELTTLPASIASLTNVSFGVWYNRLSITDPALVAFLDAYAGTQWDDFQLYPPTITQAAAQSSNSVSVAWTPATAGYNPGRFEVLVSTGGGPFVLHGVNNPNQNTYLVTGLAQGSTNTFAARSVFITGYANIRSAQSAPFTPPATAPSGCQGAAQIPTSECLALEALANSAGIIGNGNFNRWMEVDSPQILISGYGSHLIDQFGGDISVVYPAPVNAFDRRAIFSPDGTQVLTGDQFGTARLFDTISGDLLRTFCCHAEIWGLAFSADGTRILTAGGDATGVETRRVATVRLWDVIDASAPLWTVTIDLPAFNYNVVNDAAFSPDGTQVLMGYRDGNMRLLNATTGVEIRAFDGGFDNFVHAVAFSPDGSQIVGGHGDALVRLWNINDNSAPIRQFAHASNVYDVSFNTAGTRLLTGAADRLVKLWDISGPLVAQFDATGAVFSADFTPDGAQVLVGSSDVILLNATNLSLVRRFTVPGYGNNPVMYTPVAQPVGQYPCNWQGVTCTDGNVTALQMVGLSGTLPDLLGDLTQLETLSLTFGGLRGPIPATVGNLANLRTLNLSINTLEGPLPPELGSLATLETLNLDGNTIGGSIPAAWSGMTALQTAILSRNRLTGDFAPFAMLPNLQTLDLSLNFGGQLEFPLILPGQFPQLEVLKFNSSNVSGLIPPGLGNLTTLRTLDLNSNLLSGAAPPELGNLGNLQTLDLSYNDLTALPPEMSQLASLQILNLLDNELVSLPAELGNLSNLQTLELGSNFIRSVPASFANLTSLQQLGLRENDLTNFPPELGSLSNLRTLELNQNELTGFPPPPPGQYAALQTLSLQGNRLSGSIPPEFGNLSSLVTFDLSNNTLTGTIPTTFNLTSFPNIRFLYLSINGLEGEVPVELATLDDGAQGLGAVHVVFNRLTSSNPVVQAFLNQYQGNHWEEQQVIPPPNVQFLDATSTLITLSWTPLAEICDPFTNCFNYGNGYEVACAPVSGGPYLGLGRTPSNIFLDADGLTLDGFGGSETRYCVVRSFRTVSPTLEWLSANSPEVTVVTQAPFGIEIPIEFVPSVFEVEVPEPPAPENLTDVCSEETGRTVTFRGSGRTVTFRGSGRTVTFRGSGQSELLIANTAGSEFDTVLTVWRVPADSTFDEANPGLQFLGCNDNASVNTGEPGDPNTGIERPPDSVSFTSQVTVPFDIDFDLYFVAFANDDEFGNLVFNIVGDPVFSGDCNADQGVDAGDLSALVLEVFDGDGAAPDDAAGGTFTGSGVGCDANDDAVIDAGDLSCTTLLAFDSQATCGAP